MFVSSGHVWLQQISAPAVPFPQRMENSATSRFQAKAEGCLNLDKHALLAGSAVYGGNL